MKFKNPKPVFHEFGAIALGLVLGFQTYKLIPFNFCLSLQKVPSRGAIGMLGKTKCNLQDKFIKGERAFRIKEPCS